MEPKQDPSAGKLVYMRDHAARPKPRRPRPDRKIAPQSIGELAGEAGWLARALFAIALGIVAMALMHASAAATAPRGSDDAQILSMTLAGSLFVIACCTMAAWRLLRAPATSAIHLAAAAGTLALHAVEGVARVSTEALPVEPTLAHRFDVLAIGAGLATAAWGISFAQRLLRREEPAI